jgi:alpha-L-rhamnosidase
MGETQAGYALALAFGLIHDASRTQTLQRLQESINHFGSRLSTGIQSTHRLMLELGRNNLMEQAYTLALRRDLPSWGFMIDQGATTIWERWDGFAPERGFQDPGMNSFNHWALGSVGEWLYACVLGLEPDSEQPGYQHFFVKPHPGGGLTYAKGSYHSIRGEIQIAWRDNPNAFELDLVVPPNTTATVELPSGELLENDTPITADMSVSIPVKKNHRQIVEVNAGSFHFRVKK